MNLLPILYQAAFSERHTFQLFHHALATPLTSLYCTISELETNVDSERSTQLLSNLQLSVERIRKLSDVFLLSPSSSEEETFNLIASIESIISLVTTRNVHISLVVKRSVSSSVVLSGSRLLFEEAVVCVLNNAIDSYKNSDEKIITITVLYTGTQIELLIRDYGMSIAWWKKPFIFLPRVSFKTTGHGIGLSFCKQVIEHHFSGILRVNTAPSLGTEVSCLLPVHLSKNNQNPEPL